MNLMTRQDLTKAFELIEQERHDAALEILEPLLQEERNNPDVWWLYAHATADRETARDALNMVLLLKPDYPGASQLLEQLRIEPVSAGTHPITSSPAYTPPPTLPDLPPAETEEDDFDDLDFEDFDDDKPRSRLRTFLGMLFVLLIIGVIAVILIMNAGQPAPKPTPTASVGQNITQQPVTQLPVLTPQSAQPTEEVTQEAVDNFESLYIALADFVLPEDAIVIGETEFGDSLIVTICSEEGPALNQNLSASMEILAENSKPYADAYQAIAVSIFDCERNNTPRVIAVSMEDAIAFSNGAIDNKEFQRRWRVQDFRQ